LPGAADFHGLNVIPEGQSEITLKSLGVDEDYIPTYGLELIEGRNFSHGNRADQRGAVILNEEAARRLGWDEPVGKKLEFTVYIDGADKREGQVIGVVKNFHFQSLHEKIEPLVLYINKHPYYADYMTVKFQNGSIAQSVKSLNDAWISFNPDKPLEYIFLDQHLEKLYTSEKRISTIFNVLSYISVFISCLGLFSLSAFMAEQRTREVGIRKVLGASFPQIVMLQFKEFLPLIIAANIIAWPIVWWMARDWLNNFAYHVQLSPFLFLAVLAGSVMVVCLTLTYFSVSAATRNPVSALKHE
jgi:putative ABC transport system permease protein